MAFGGNLHINKALQNLSIKYRNNQLIGSDVIKDLPVMKESDLFYSHVRDFRLADTFRANKSESNQESWNVSTASYSLNEHALSDVITDRDRKNVDAPITLDMDTTEFLTDKILLGYEKAVADVMFTTASWSGYATLDTATSWAYNTTTSAPILNMLSGTAYIEINSGVSPTDLILGHATYVALKENPNLYSRLAYTERQIMTKDLMAAIFDVNMVHVGKAIYDASLESGIGNTAIAEDITSIWGANALLYYKNPTVSRKQVTAALNFKMGAQKVKKWREEKIAGDIIEVSTMYKPRVICSNAAYYWVSCTNI